VKCRCSIQLNARQFTADGRKFTADALRFTALQFTALRFIDPLADSTLTLFNSPLFDSSTHSPIHR
jgi:hypothetical protein